MLFQLFIGLASLIAGSIASIAGFGIGSLVTPAFAFATGTSLAVAAVSVVHFCGTALRFMLLRQHINKKVFLGFGFASAAGGLVGALLHNVLYNVVLTVIFGCLLVFAGVTGLTGLSGKLRFRGLGAWLAGGLSGLFGGLVGNQGGIRSAALFGFHLEPKEFVATATGIALMVDVARVPVYLAAQGQQMAALWPTMLVATVGVLIGTVVGGRVLRKIPEPIFSKLVSTIILGIGILVLVRH